MARNIASPGYVTVGKAPAIQLTGAMTIGVWAKTTNTGFGTLFGGYENGGGYAGYALVASRTTAGRTGYYNNSAGWVEGSTAWNDGAWHYVSVTGFGTAGKFFVDGHADGTFTYGNPSANTGYDKYIGALPDTSLIFSGHVSDFAIWSTDLTQGEVILLSGGMNPLDVRRNKLVGYWPLSGLSITERDATAYGTHASLVNFPACSPGPAVRAPSRPFRKTLYPRGAAAASTVKFRRTLSGVGTRMGSRQVQS